MGINISKYLGIDVNIKMKLDLDLVERIGKRKHILYQGSKISPKFEQIEGKI